MGRFVIVLFAVFLFIGGEALAQPFGIASSQRSLNTRLCRLGREGMCLVRYRARAKISSCWIP